VLRELLAVKLVIFAVEICRADYDGFGFDVLNTKLIHSGFEYAHRLIL